MSGGWPSVRGQSIIAARIGWDVLAADAALKHAEVRLVDVVIAVKVLGVAA